MVFNCSSQFFMFGLVFDCLASFYLKIWYGYSTFCLLGIGLKGLV